MIQGPERWRGTQGMLQPQGCFYHGGFAGTNYWGDPLHNLLGVFLSVSTRFDANGDYRMENDLFQNMVTSAVTQTR